MIKIRGDPVSWFDVASQDDEALKNILLEEGIPEGEMEAEIEKLKKNANVSSQVRAVLITPEVDKILAEIFRFGRDETLSRSELDKVKEALWPQQ